jgi:hypothetical protein
VLKDVCQCAVDRKRWDQSRGLVMFQEMVRPKQWYFAYGGKASRCQETKRIVLDALAVLAP